MDADDDPPRETDFAELADPEVDDGPELALEDMDGGEVILEVDCSAPPTPRAVPPRPREPQPPSDPPPRSRFAVVGESLRGDWGRLLATGLKAAAWLGLATLVLNQPGILAAVVAGALAGDIVIWFVIRVLELPRHLWAFQVEALTNLVAVWALVDLMHLFDTFRDPERLPFGVVTFMLVGLGRFVAYWVPRVLSS